MARSAQARKQAPENDIADRVAALDWGRIATELDSFGCATTGPLLGAEECAAIAARYDEDAIYRSRVIMARHGFGRGEYKYFAYPLPDTVAALRASLYPPLAQVANRWNEQMGLEQRFPARSRRLSQALPRGGTDAADAAAAAIRRGRLQLPAPGRLWRAGVPAAGRVPAVAAGRGFFRRRVRAHRAAPAHAVARRGGAAEPGGGRDLPGASPPGAGHARRLPRQHAPRREPAALGPAPHARDHFPRREVAAAKPLALAAGESLFSAHVCRTTPKPTSSRSSTSTRRTRKQACRRSTRTQPRARSRAASRRSSVSPGSRRPRPASTA